MEDTTAIRFKRPEWFRDELTELLRIGARQLVAQAVEAELRELLEEHGGRKLAVRWSWFVGQFRVQAKVYSLG